MKEGWLVRLVTAITLVVFILAFSLSTMAAPDGGSKLVSLEFANADIRDILQVLADLGGLNLITDPAVRGKVSVTLNEIPLEDAVALVSHIGGYQVKDVNGVYVVGIPAALDQSFPEKIETRVFDLHFVAPSEVVGPVSLIVPSQQIIADDVGGVLVVRGSKNQLDEVQSLLGHLDVARIGSKASLPDISGEDDMQEEGQEVKVEPPTVTHVIWPNYSTVDALASAISLVAPGAEVKADTETGALIVKATQAQIDAITPVIGKLDRPKPQVHIQARLEELSEDAKKELGLEWEVNLESQVLDPVTITSELLGRLRLLEETGKSMTLAKPEISTMSGESARILLGDRVPIPVEEIVDGQKTISIEYVEAGVKLEITPVANFDGYITVDIRPEISTISDYVMNNYPIISTREAQTKVRIRDGETIAIGGLFQTKEIVNMMSLPGLSKLPILGKLFTSERKEFDESEIVIFITAKVDYGPAWEP